LKTTQLTTHQYLQAKPKVHISYVPLDKIELEAKKESPGHPGLRSFKTETNRYNPFTWSNLPLSPLPGRI
jgi:hypothetical protein